MRGKFPAERIGDRLAQARFSDARRAKKTKIGPCPFGFNLRTARYSISRRLIFSKS